MWVFRGLGADRRIRPAWVGAGPILARMEETLDAKPAHYRLSRATWEIILEAYRNGATVPELSERWRVSQHALRKRITVHGATKRDWGDARAREQAEARERMQAERAAAEAVRAEALFAPSEGDADETAEVLAETAMRASARAMRGRMWDEARALAQLAEAYGRMAQRSERARGRGEVTLDDIPLELVKALALNQDQCASSRLAIWDEADPHPAQAGVLGGQRRPARGGHGRMAGPDARAQDAAGSGARTGGGGGPERPLRSSAGGARRR